MATELHHIQKAFGSFKALDDVTLHIPQGELLALLGPSGSGKTTLLRVLGGVDLPDSGTILENGVDLTTLPARERNVGLVFQHFALFPHLDVKDNVAFALKVRKRPKEEIAQRVDELLGLVQLRGMAHRRPAELSGGQRQRVALARALAAKPRILLLDEPFSALDAKVRKELRRWLRELHDELGTTTVFVTHDQEEAFELADRVVVFNKGRIEQVGTPAEVYDAPAGRFVLDFLGGVSWIHPDGGAEIGVREHDVTLHPAGETGPERWAGTLAHLHRSGPSAQVDVKLQNGELVTVAVDPQAVSTLTLGAPVTVAARKIWRFPS